MRTILLFLFFSVVCVCPLFAASPHTLGEQDSKSDVSSTQSDYGVKLLNEGKMNLATTHFIKALLINPSNTIAKTRLKNIAQNPDMQGKGQGLSLLRFVELADFSHFLKSRIKILDNSNTQLVNFILKNEESDESIIKKVHSIQSEIEDTLHSSRTEPGILKPDPLPERLNLKELNRDLINQKRRLMGQLGQRRRMNDHLRPLKIRVIKNMNTLKKQKSSRELAKQIEDIKMKMTVKEGAFNAQRESLDRLTEELGTVRHDFDEVQVKLTKTDRRVAELTGELAKMSLTLYEKGKLLGDKDDRLKSIENSLMDANQRLNLVQRIIQEKDEHIHVLKDELVRLQDTATDTDQGTAGPQQRYALSIDTEAPLGQSDSNLARIQLLEQQFQALNEKYSRMEEKVKAKDNAISQLKDTVLEKNKKILTVKAVSLLKNYKMVQLSGIVQIYRERLKDTHADLMETIERIDQLEDLLIEKESRLNAYEERQVLEQYLQYKDIDIWSRAEILDQTKERIRTWQENF